MNAPTILVCHGMNSCSYRFEKYIHLLLQHNVNVYAFDAQAHGKSTGKILNAVIYSEIIEQVEVRYGPLNGIIAHSIAGMATSFAMERLQKPPIKLVLIAPATGTVTAVDNFFRIFNLDEGFRSIFDRTVQELRGLPVSWYSATGAVKNIANPCCGSTTKTISFVRTPTLLKYATQLPNVRFITTKGLGHNKIYRDKEVQNDH